MKTSLPNKAPNSVLYKQQVLENALYIIATPIGNLRDISLRALDVLASVDRLYAEDTRHSKYLFEFYHLKVRELRPYHDYSHENIRQQILSALAEGQSIGLVSDAGTPLISDPGYKLVKDVKKAGFSVIPLPGASAFVTALSGAGLPTHQFCFSGFPPVRAMERKAFYQDLADLKMTLVFYESAKRIVKTLKAMQISFGNRFCVVARELTKKFETFIEGDFQTLIDFYENQGAPKGEIVLLVAGAEKVTLNQEEIEEILSRALQEASLKEAVSDVSTQLGLSRRKLYQMALEITKTEK